MQTNDRDKLNRLEELKGRLFTKNFKTKIEHRDKFTHTHAEMVPDAWGEGGANASSLASIPNKFLTKTAIFRNFFIFSVLFFILTLGYAAYIFFGGGNTVSNDNIDIAITGNDFTAGGEELPFSVGITNKNSSALDLVDLIMEYPKGTSGNSTSSSAGTEQSRQSLGTIPAGAVRNENMKVVLFGEQGSVRTIKFSLEYRVEGSNGLFIKTKNYDVTIKSTPLDLSVDAPSEISPNQDITLKVHATLNSTKTASNMLLKIDYPVGFQFASATPAPSLGNNTWNLGDLATAAERKISVTGKMIDAVDGEEKVFRISSGSQPGSDKSTIDTIFNSVSQTIAIKKPFIDATLFVNGVSDREYAINTHTGINAEIKWTNNLDTKVNDLEIRAKITGNAYDRRTINASQGFYNSLGGEDVIIWNKNYLDGFKEVAPGASSSVSFSLGSLPIFSATTGLLVDPSIKIEISISGKQLVSGYANTDLKNSDSRIIRIISDVGFTNKALYFSGPFANTGPIPPRVEKQTTYTVVWSISNTANNVSKGVVHSSLPPWIKFVGSVSPSGEDLTYNASTREIVWNAGRVDKGAGITGVPRSVAFQVSFIPSLSQVKTTPVIIDDAVLTAHDDFANVDVRFSKGSLRTLLDGDPSFPGDGGSVVE
ncbi:MAG: hypothetical protein WCI76_01740 [bacterium]